MASPTSEYQLPDTASEEEQELIQILIDSSLFRDMYPDEKQKLLNYLVSSYFKTTPARTSGSLPW